MLTLDKVYHASFVLKNIIRKTDMILAPNINPESEIHLKTENLQVTGSFKVRGAAYKISQLSEEEKARGVIACSAGNHAQGVAFAIKELNPNVKVYGVQASGAPSMLKSIDDGKIEKLDSVSTIADGIAVKEPGDITFAMCQKYVDGIVTVSDDEIAAAILALIEQQKLITEGAGAVSVAAAMFNKVDVKGKKV